MCRDIQEIIKIVVDPKKKKVIENNNCEFKNEPIINHPTHQFKPIISREEKLKKQLDENKKWQVQKARNLCNLSRNSKQIKLKINNEFNTHFEPKVEKLYSGDGMIYDIVFAI